MNVVMQQTKKTLMSHCHLLMEQRRYAMAAKIIDFELDD